MIEIVRPATDSVQPGSSAVAPVLRVTHSAPTSRKPNQNGSRFHSRSVRAVHSQDQRTRVASASEVVAVIGLPHPSVGGTSIDNQPPNLKRANLLLFLCLVRG